MAASSMILCYHSLDDSGSVISVLPRTFRWQMQCLAASGRPVVSLARALEVPGSVAITFDDGFRSFHEHALPVLREHSLPATVFVVTGHCGGRNNWPSQPEGVPRFDLMTWNEIREASRNGITIGAHTVNHPWLSRIPAEQALAELRESREEIEQRTGGPVGTFAYPYGDHNATVREMACSLFPLSCGTDLNFIGSRPSLDNLARLDAYYLRNNAVFQKLIDGEGHGYILARRSLRNVRRWMVH